MQLSLNDALLARNCVEDCIFNTRKLMATCPDPELDANKKMLQTCSDFVARLDQLLGRMNDELEGDSK